MADLMDLIGEQLGGAALQQISKQLGASESQSQSAIQSALPVLLGAMARNSSSSGGAGALGAALDKDHDGSILDDLAGFIGKSDQGPGAGILKHVLGGQRNKVEQYVGKSSGLSAGNTTKLLEILAPIVMGNLGRQKREQSLDAGGLAGLLGGMMQTREKQAPQQNQLLSGLLDQDGDGDVSDDLLSVGSKLLGGLFKR